MFSIYANWKSNKNLSSMREWFDTVRDRLSPEAHDGMRRGVIEIVVFPPSPLLYPLHVLCIGVDGFRVGIQDISALPEGSHTGLVSASSVQGIVSHVIVGHAEVRERGDTQEIVQSKYDQAIRHLLHPVLCISRPEEQIKDAPIVAFEPLSAIGSDMNASLEDVIDLRHDLHYPVSHYIYGGSVRADNCKEYLNPRICDGFLVGRESLDPIGFAALVSNCARYALD